MGLQGAGVRFAPRPGQTTPASNRLPPDETFALLRFWGPGVGVRFAPRHGQETPPSFHLLTSPVSASRTTPYRQREDPDSDVYRAGDSQRPIPPSDRRPSPTPGHGRQTVSVAGRQSGDSGATVAARARRLGIPEAKRGLNVVADLEPDPATDPNAALMTD